jgi:hypothetical protein
MDGKIFIINNKFLMPLTENLHSHVVFSQGLFREYFIVAVKFKFFWDVFDTRLWHNTNFPCYRN